MKPSERILMEVAEKASPEYKKRKALRHFMVEAEETVFDKTTFGKREEAVNHLPLDYEIWVEETVEELDGVLDL